VQPLPGAAHPIAAKIPPPNSQKCAYFAQKRIDKSAPECYYCTAKQNTEWYRRGHNGMDSKSIVRFVRPWVQIPPTPPKARQPPSFPGFLFAAESLVQINKMYIPDAHGLL
jgi:hypothetical protein